MLRTPALRQQLDVDSTGTMLANNITIMQAGEQARPRPRDAAGEYKEFTKTFCQRPSRVENTNVRQDLEGVAIITMIWTEHYRESFQSAHQLHPDRAGRPTKVTLPDILALIPAEYQGLLADTLLVGRVRGCLRRRFAISLRKSRATCHELVRCSRSSETCSLHSNTKAEPISL